MSYILDALKRADTERERGLVPGLHSQSAAPAGSPPSKRRGARSRLWPLLIGAALLVLVAYVVLAPWLMPLPPDAPASQPQQGGQAAPEAASTASAAPPAAPAPPPTPAAVQPAEAVSDTPDTMPPRPILAPAPPPPAPAPAPSPAAAPAAAPTTAAAPMPATGQPDPARVPSFAELSAEARAQLPPVSVNGSSYSANPAHRILIVNGKVVQEGQEIAPGLTLERMGAHSAVLNHKGLRYSIGY